MEPQRLQVLEHLQQYLLLQYLPKVLLSYQCHFPIVDFALFRV